MREFRNGLLRQAIGWTLAGFSIFAVMIVAVGQQMAGESREATRCLQHLGDIGAICIPWVEQCRSKPGCDFEAYWPPLAEEYLAEHDLMERRLCRSSAVHPRVRQGMCRELKSST